MACEMQGVELGGLLLKLSCDLVPAPVSSCHNPCSLYLALGKKVWGS